MTRTPLMAGQPCSLRSLGYDEKWLQDWLASDPSHLGLGQVKILDQEQGHPGAGFLDLLAIDAESDTYYSIEIQLGEVDASHSFRVFDYWARNRLRFAGKTHVAVLVAESATGRFRPALEALAETVPLIVIEMRTWQGAGEALLVPEIVVANESLDLAETTAGNSSGGDALTEEIWREQSTDEAWKFKDEFVAWALENLGPVRVSYSVKSYVGVRVGRRVWAPLWLRTDGATVHLPDPDGSRSDDPSVAFDHFESRLSEDGLLANWQPNYNAGANPISIRMRREDLTKASVQELLRASYGILGSGAEPWSETNEASASAPSNTE